MLKAACVFIALSDSCSPILPTTYVQYVIALLSILQYPPIPRPPMQIEYALTCRAGTPTSSLACSACCDIGVALRASHGTAVENAQATH